MTTRTTETTGTNHNEGIALEHRTIDVGGGFVRARDIVAVVRLYGCVYPCEITLVQGKTITGYRDPSDIAADWHQWLADTSLGERFQKRSETLTADQTVVFRTASQKPSAGAQVVNMGKWYAVFLGTECVVPQCSIGPNRELATELAKVYQRFGGGK